MLTNNGKRRSALGSGPWGQTANATRNAEAGKAKNLNRGEHTMHKFRSLPFEKKLHTWRDSSALLQC